MIAACAADRTLVVEDPRPAGHDHPHLHRAAGQHGHRAAGQHGHQARMSQIFLGQSHSPK